MAEPLLAFASPPACECTYNLFRNRRRPDLFCAVPEHRPVPNFLAPKDWAFERPLYVAEPAPAGFDDQAATVGVRFNGFYLFQSIASPSRMAAWPCGSGLYGRAMGYRRFQSFLSDPRRVDLA